LLGIVAMAMFASIATAAVTLKAGKVYFYVLREHFSITLQAKSAKQIAAGNVAANVGESDVLVVCPTTASAPTVELLASFPGAKLKLSHGRYGFKLSYTETHARLNTISGPGAGTHTSVEARVKVTGTLASATLIKGTVSVTATGCSQPTAQYRATLDKSL
jgi:hypothetical protein